MSKLSDLMKKAAVPMPASEAPRKGAFVPRGKAVPHSRDLDRILAIPRRAPLDLSSTRAQAMADLVTERYSNGRPADSGCDCREIDPRRFLNGAIGCVTSLLPVQAWTLYEMGLAGGAIGSIGVGSGKTILNILGMFPLGAQKALALIPSNLLGQFWDDYRLLSEHFRVPSVWIEGIKKGIKHSGEPDLYVLPYGLLSRPGRSAYIDDLKPDAIICDECFPGDTLVTTDVGDVPIGDVVDKGVGTMALTYKEGWHQWRSITRRLKKVTQKRLVRITHETGQVVCTEDHKVWTTTRGYTKAGTLTGEDHLVTRETYTDDLHDLQHVHADQKGRQEDRQDMLPQMHGETDQSTNPGQESPRKVAQTAGESLGVQRVSGSQGPGACQTEGPDISGTRRERSADCSSETVEREARAIGRQHGMGHLREGPDGYLPEPTHALQGRHRPAGGEAGDRGGRKHPQDQEMAVPGQTQDSRFRTSRVVRVEVLEQGSDGGDGQSGGGDPVYDLTVDVEHNYFANGVLVSNCDKLSDIRGSATARRVLRYYVDYPSTKFAGWTGSLTDKKISDYTHLLVMALKASAPVPHDPSEVVNWGGALDVTDMPSEMGALRALLRPEDYLIEDEIKAVRRGYYRRLSETLGMITTSENDVEVSDATGSIKGSRVEVVVSEKVAPPIPDIVMRALDSARGYVRPDKMFGSPDDEELESPTEKARAVAEIASGVMNVWKFPPTTPDRKKFLALDKGGVYQENKVIDDWYAIRREWNKSVRKQVIEGAQHFDSPYLCEMAAARFHGDEPEKLGYPVWDNPVWPAWRDIRKKVKPQAVAIRIHPYIVEDAAKWALQNTGIVWYSVVEFGKWVSEVSGLPMHGGGSKAPARLKAERGDRSIIASVDSHGRGRNGLQFLFADQLITQIPSSSKRWEQLLGRLIRRGQLSDEVTTWMYLHVPELRDAIDQALRRSEFVTDTLGMNLKLRTGWEAHMQK